MNQILEKRKTEKIDSNVGSLTKERQLQIIKCLKEGLPLNVANYDKNCFKTINNEECSIHPSSFLLK